MIRIGIIEDDRLLNEALCTYLETLGYLTDSAFSFEEGMALAESRPDLLLLDIGLAAGSGIEICRTVRGRAPVIFLTAKDGEEDMLRAFDCGADDYLVKPFPMPVLAAHIQAVLRRSGGSRKRNSHRLSYSFAYLQIGSACRCKGIYNLKPYNYGIALHNAAFYGACQFRKRHSHRACTAQKRVCRNGKHRNERKAAQKDDFKRGAAVQYFCHTYDRRFRQRHMVYHLPRYKSKAGIFQILLPLRRISCSLCPADTDMRAHISHRI